MSQPIDDQQIRALIDAWCEASSAGDLTARDTAAHTIRRSLNWYTARAVGITANPEYVLVSNLLPSVMYIRFGITSTSSCAKKLKIVSS